MSDGIKNSLDESTIGIRVDITNKRKRVKRIKAAIIITVIFLFLLPTILCIVLGIRLSQLQRQVDNLYSTYSSKYDDRHEMNIVSKHASASTEKQDDEDVFESDEAQIQLRDNNEEDVDGRHTDISDNGDNIDYSSDSDIEIVDDVDSIDDADTSKNATDSVENDIDMTEDGIDATEIDTNEDIKDPDDDLIMGPDTTEIPDENVQNDSKYTVEYYRDPDGKYYDKRIYLTFDDGPSNITDEILDILDEYKVKATFFVIGHDDEASIERYKRIVNEGHVVAIHSYSHKYKEIYKSLENFDKDFTKLWNLLYDTTGYIPTLYRFPGGSLSLSKSKLKQYASYLDDKGMKYYDWNVVNGDAEGINYTQEQMIDNVLNGVAQRKTSIVLMHDGYGKEKTAATLPKILDALISGGAEVLPMDDEAPLIQQIKASSLK